MTSALVAGTPSYIANTVRPVPSGLSPKMLRMDGDVPARWEADGLSCTRAGFNERRFKPFMVSAIAAGRAGTVAGK